MGNVDYNSRELHPGERVIWSDTGWTQSRFIAELESARSAEQVTLLLEELRAAWRRAHWMLPDAEIELPGNIWALVASHTRHLDARLLTAIASQQESWVAFSAQSLASYPDETRNMVLDVMLDIVGDPDAYPDALVHRASATLQYEASEGGLAFGSQRGRRLAELWDMDDRSTYVRRDHVAMVFAMMVDTPSAVLVETTKVLGFLGERATHDYMCALVRHPNTTEEIVAAHWQQVEWDRQAQAALFSHPWACKSPVLQRLVAKRLGEDPSVLEPRTLAGLLPYADRELRHKCWRQLLITDVSRGLVLRMLRGAPDSPVHELLRSEPELVLGCNDAAIRQAAVIALSSRASEEKAPPGIEPTANTARLGPASGHARR